tara:strand:+ start:2004 stop:2948 length:945 start_codon:yes stop_codon:yes gene_type:complete
MRVYLNRKPKTGPWGGGIKTVNKLVEELEARDHEVVFNLQPGIDIIFCIDPRPNDIGEWYQNFINYKSYAPESKIIQRVGDLGTHSKPELTTLVKQTLNLSDYFIFPSEWAQEWIGFTGENCRVIHNAPMEVFHLHKNTELAIADKPRLITHHWSTNPKKGFHLYKQLDEHIQKTGEFEFTYAGRLPDGLSLSNYKPPVGARLVAKELQKNDIYVTASIEEAGANHVLEALAVGLPVVYHKDGGSINNYCHKYGEEFSSFEEMLESIRKIASNYKSYKEKTLEYKVDNSSIVDQYIEIIEEICDETEDSSTNNS